MADEIHDENDDDFLDESARLSDEDIAKLLPSSRNSSAPPKNSSHNAASSDSLNASANDSSKEAVPPEIPAQNSAIENAAFGKETAGTEKFPNGMPFPLPTTSARCIKCGTTWDRLKQDGRAGCGQCYVAFARELANVMERVQKTSQHAGKAPRAMAKRQLRLMHLRRRRDNRLEMLQRRLQESLECEDYEEAAKLRDKIKIVSSTILDV